MTPRLDGIDISRHNHVTSWAAVPRFELVSLKATEGQHWVDPTFGDRWSIIRSRGTRFRGAYHWLRPDSAVKGQFAHFAETIDSHGGLRPGELVQLDWERTRSTVTGEYLRWLSVDEVDEWVGLAEDRWPGRTVVYTGAWVLGFVEWRDRNPDFPLWFADYSPKGPARARKWGAVLHQWTDKARVDGFKAGIDGNEIIDRAAVERLAGLEGGTEQEVCEMTVRYVRADGELAVFSVDGCEVRWVPPSVAAVLDITHVGWRASIEVVDPAVLAPFRAQVP